MLNDFQFKSFDVWKSVNMSNELRTTYNDESINNNKTIINDLIKELPDNVIMYQLENNYHIHRMDDRKIRGFSKIKRVKRVPVYKVKTNSLPDILIPDDTTLKIFFLKDKIKNHDTINDIDWVNFKNYFVYDHNFSDKKLLKPQINQSSNCKKTKSKIICLKHLWDNSVLYAHCYILLN